ncbi:hypothetical protein J422_02849 [Methanocaldococcus villosus KIN24-T80]|uniref:Uncharacterized protein n=1 Tax=Methanocaldococcus villosus KIN24-T80 TaxID=1069083 RepID=N6V273_9EURY|nr:DUF190 domain-containing protein [Methanocaldococcus villosus]ENN96378.1 hypothetical protein J422_02849 [Methanocaldococcus villosus KIN24-T80]
MLRAKILRIYLKEGDKYNDEPAYKYILKLLKKEGISGATVFRGVAGYGVRGISQMDIFRLSINLPIVIECVDLEENINRVLPKIHKVINNNGLIVVMKCKVYLGEKE